MSIAEWDVNLFWDRTTRIRAILQQFTNPVQLL
jgi:hypothetical protein